MILEMLAQFAPVILIVVWTGSIFHEKPPVIFLCE